MKILVDADDCPVVSQIEAIARKHHIPVILFCDTHHILHSTYSEIKTNGVGALCNLCDTGDVVVTQDYEVAAMALWRQAYALHSSGLRYTDENISRMLDERHMVKEQLRRSFRNSSLRGAISLMQKDDGSFKAVLEELVQEASA